MKISRAGLCKDTYRLSTACMDIYKAGTLNVSKKISAAFLDFCVGSMAPRSAVQDAVT